MLRVHRQSTEGDTPAVKLSAMRHPPAALFIVVLSWYGTGTLYGANDDATNGDNFLPLVRCTWYAQQQYEDLTHHWPVPRDEGKHANVSLASLGSRE